MNVDVMAWNACNGLTDPSRSTRIIDAMLKSSVSDGLGFEPDVIAVPEAFDATNPEKLNDDFGRLSDRLNAEGYEAGVTPYDDGDDRPDKHAFLMMSRLPGSLFLPNYTGTRTTLSVYAPDSEIGGFVEIVGVHLDDRTLGGRLLQVMNMIHQRRRSGVSGEPSDLLLPTALIGDFNAMHAGDPKARLWRNSLVRALAHSVKAGEPGTKQSKIARAASIGQRLCDMADPAVMWQLTASGYVEADPTFEPTFNSKRPFIQLDHIMTNKGFVVAQHNVHEDTGLSDHRAISAKLITEPSILF